MDQIKNFGEYFSKYNINPRMRYRLSSAISFLIVLLGRL